MKKIVLSLGSLFFCGYLTVAQAKLPLEFIGAPNVVRDMALGQTQTLTYLIQNQSSRTALPLRDLSVRSLGDAGAASVFLTNTTCGNWLLPLASCSITVQLQALTEGSVNRFLYINYNGRAPLISPIRFEVGAAHYTVLVYMVGADLESQHNLATGNILQMMQVGSSKNVNIVIETGGANKNGWRTVQRKLVLPGGVSLIKDLGNISMGDGRTIQDFLTWGVSTFPAEKYIAVFWDHGGGPLGGFGGSESSPPPRSTPINELAAVVEKTAAITGRRFEIIGFDACFLGNTETFAGLYPYANYLIGSEDLEPGFGWQYNTFLRYLNENPSADGFDIGRQIVDGYTLQNQGESTTLSVIKSESMPALLSTIDDFASLLHERLNTPGQELSMWKTIAKSRFRAPDYGTSVWDNKSYDVVDLLEFAKAIQFQFGLDAPLVAAANLVIDAINDSVVYYKNSPNRERSFGLTTYYPSIMQQYDDDYPLVTKLQGVEFFSTNYVNLVSAYNAFYVANQSSLIASLSNFAYDSSTQTYSVDVNNDYDEMYAAVGSDHCTSVLDNEGNPIDVPCIRSIQNPDTSGAQGSLSFNKAANLNNWTFVNNVPVLLIPNDTNPDLPDEDTFLIPAASKDLGIGFITVIKDKSGQYEAVGFQKTSGSVNTQGKLLYFYDGDEFTIRTYADNEGIWSLRNTNLTIKAPLTISWGAAPNNLDRFRFLVGDLTGKLTITATGLAY